MDKKELEQAIQKTVLKIILGRHLARLKRWWNNTKTYFKISYLKEKKWLKILMF